MKSSKKPFEPQVEIVGSMKRERGRPRKRFDPVPWNKSDQYGFCLTGKLKITKEEKIEIEETVNA